ncbi:MAG: hypothetical protein PHE99_01340, partial [Bacteroidales bacterium]|nr:hypothetical protein [Bacteroidales bacterium]
PLTCAKEINRRKEIFAFFQQNNFSLPFHKKEWEKAEQYIENSESKSIIGSISSNIKRKAKKLIANDKELKILEEGLLTTVSIIKKTEQTIKKISECNSKNNPFIEDAPNTLALFHDKKIESIYNLDTTKSLTFKELIKNDYILRTKAIQILHKIVTTIHYLDLYISVASIGKERDFKYANCSESNKSNITIEGLCHPRIENAVKNNLDLSKKSNILFLTGANMAGKSTLMKSFGIAIYLAHMGFPLAVESMEFNVQNGMYTSINVPDNLNMGYSHFYAEVIRVKKIALEVSSGKNLVILFDELFKGTNVKDAYDATVTITESFAAIDECKFIISTHIMEAGETLKERCSNIQLKFLPTTLKGNKPYYSYTLEDGISNDRHGMTIINNEKIIETIVEKNS